MYEQEEDTLTVNVYRNYVDAHVSIILRQTNINQWKTSSAAS